MRSDELTCQGGTPSCATEALLLIAGCHIGQPLMGIRCGLKSPQENRVAPWDPKMARRHWARNLPTERRLAVPMGRGYDSVLLRSMGPVRWTSGRGGCRPQAALSQTQQLRVPQWGPGRRGPEVWVQLCLDPGLIGREVHYSADAKFLIVSALMR